MLHLTTKPYSALSKSAKESFLELFKRRAYQRAYVLLIGAIILYPAWTINDYLFAPEWYFPFLYMRLGVLFILAVLFYYFKNNQIAASTALHIILIPIIIEVAFMCSVVSEKALIPFLLGFTTVYAVIYTVALISPKTSFFYWLLGVSSWFLFIAIYRVHPVAIYLEKGGALFLTVSIFALILNISNYHSVLNEIKARVLLDESHKELEKKNKEIIDSINYSQRIQRTILPKQETIDRFFTEYFLWYLPKDIVAGDFYWLEKYDNYKYIAVADCTGHGVPGAMVSVVCSSALTKSLIEEHIVEPGKILDCSRQIIIDKFSKSNEKVRDGMDISLCKLDEKNQLIYWSGANNPLWIYRYKSKQIEEFLPNKQPVGDYPKHEPFNTLTIPYEKNDIVILFSDGLQDQFGGPKRKKLKARKIKQIIEENASLPLKEIKYKLENFFQQWKGDLEQTDDICFLAFKC